MCMCKYICESLMYVYMCAFMSGLYVFMDSQVCMCISEYVSASDEYVYVYLCAFVSV